MIETIGWFGSMVLATCGVPFVIDAYRSKGKTISLPFVLQWLFGEILLIIFILCQPVIILPLVFNYGFNILCLIFVLWIYIKSP